MSCGGNSVLDQTTLTNDFTSKMVCVGSAGAWKNQEYHASSGAIVDYKRGPAGPGNNDPTSTIGTWSTGTAGEGNGNTRGTITYTYTNGPTFTYMVALSGNTLFFCTSSAGNNSALFQGTLEPSTGTIGAAQACT